MARQDDDGMLGLRIAPIALALTAAGAGACVLQEDGWHHHGYVDHTWNDDVDREPAAPSAGQPDGEDPDGSGGAGGSGGGTHGSGGAGGSGGAAAEAPKPWGRLLGGPSAQAPGGLALDAAGNAVIAGDFREAIDAAGIALAAVAEREVFVAKLDPEGKPLWAERLGGGDAGHAAWNARVAVTPTGDVIVSGHFHGAIDLGGDVLVNPQGVDAFVARLDGQTGAPLWSHHVNAATAQGIGAIAVDATGDVVIAGDASYFDPSAPGAAPESLRVTRLDGDTGTPLWSATFGAALTLDATGVAVDAAGDVIVTGSYSNGSLEFGSGALTSGGDASGFVLKLARATGSPLWSVGMGQQADEWCRGVAVDAAGDVFVLGTGRELDLGGGLLESAGTSSFLARLDGQTGAHAWSRFLTDSPLEIGRALSVSPTGELLVAGWFQGQADFGAGPVVSPAVDDIDLYVMRLDAASGATTWSWSAPSAGAQKAAGVAGNAEGLVFVLGELRGKLDFGDGELASVDEGDVVVGRLSP